LSEDSLEEKALALIKSRPNGVLQSDLWKDLDIDSRKCSRVIAKLEADGKIKRTWETVKGTRTYRISYLPQKTEAPKKEVDFDLILSNGQVAPCIGCTYECEPDYCPDLGNWVEMLARAPLEEEPKVQKARPPIAKEVEEPVVEEPAPVKGKKAAKAPAKAVPEKIPEKVAEKAPAKAIAKAPAKASKPVKAEKPAKEEKPAKAPASKPPVTAKKGKPAEEAPVKPAAKPTKAAKGAKSKK
jgi:hypothetical protein